MWVYVLLGVIQGVFEWIPISSEGVSALFAHFFITGLKPVEAALFLHLGTLFSVLVYFRKAWWDVVLLRERELCRFLAIATIASLAVGFPIYLAVKSMAVGNGLLVLTGLGLLATACLHHRRRAISVSTGRLAVFAGLLQGLAVIPGLSRSAATVFGLSLGKTDSAEILKDSYMMSAPVVAAAAAYIWLQDPAVAAATWPALVSSFAVGFISLYLLMKFAARINISRLAVAFAVLCFVGAGIGFIV